MAAQQRLDIRMNQQLVMTPQLRMAIELLQMNALDLQGFLQKEMLENPYLENEDNTSEEANTTTHDNRETDAAEAMQSDSMPDELAVDAGWDSMYDSGRGASSQGAASLDGESSWEDLATQEKTLRDHLLEQLGLATTDPILTFLGRYLVDAIDDAGYLTIDMAQAAKALSVEPAKLEEALAIIQTFEPTGVGARSLAECLKLQLEATDKLEYAAQVVLDNLDLLARKDMKTLARRAGVDVDEIQDICAEIRNLTPKPGLKYGSDVATSVVPDLVVSKTSEGQWQVELNAEAMPRMLIRNDLAVSSRKASSEDKSFMTEKMSRAQWLMKSLEQRARTIYKVGKALLDMQRDFFEYGVESLQPLTLRQVADAIEVHESTVSRVTTGKYIQTPLGVFELKYFFSSGIGTTGGNVEVAAESVKAMIKRIIGQEEPSKPYSDEKLVELLKREGIDVARRTVAKYRESMNIPSTSRRRVRL